MYNSCYSSYSKTSLQYTDETNQNVIRPDEEINHSLKSYETREIETLTGINDLKFV